MQKDFQPINLRKLISTKKPRLARWIPGFVLRWVESILHLEAINRVLTTKGHLRGSAFADYVINEEVRAKLNVTGIEHIPPTGGAIMVSNHPLGGLEGMVLISVAARRRPDIKVIVNRILGEIPNFSDLFIPVNNLGKKGKASLQKVEETYAENGLVIVFPAGLCSRKTNGIIKDVPWQKSFISRAVKYNLPVIPVYFSGKNTNRFYNLANFRKKLGLKTNIEMFLLVDELYRQKGKTFDIIIGSPIRATTFNGSKTQQEWAYAVQEHVYRLSNAPHETFPESE